MANNSTGFSTLLNDFGRQFAGHDRPVAIGTLDAVQIGVIDLVVGKEGTLVPWMSWLAAAFPLLGTLGLGRFDDVAGRRLGGVAGVLLGGGEFRFDLRKPNLKLLHELHHTDTLDFKEMLRRNAELVEAVRSKLVNAQTTGTR